MAEDNPVVKQEYLDPDIVHKAPVDVEDLQGLVPNISAEPTYTPRKLIEQFRVQSSTIWVYDVDNRDWFRLGQDKMYAGLVTSTGDEGTPFQSGWTSSTTGTGFYVITHNLGHTNYVPIVFPYSSQVRSANVTSLGTTSFTVNIKNSGGTDTDNAFYFMVKDMN